MTSSTVAVLFLLQTLTFINTDTNQKQNKLNVQTHIPIGNLHENKYNTIDESTTELYKNVNSNIFDEIYEENEETHYNTDTPRSHDEITKHSDLNIINIRENDQNRQINTKNNNIKSIYVRKNEALDFRRKNVRKYNRNKKVTHNLAVYENNARKIEDALNPRDVDGSVAKVRVKRNDDPRCDTFDVSDGMIEHPHAKNGSTYYSNINCVVVINDQAGRVIELTFVDVFGIEDHPTCAYDYLEIRDGRFGYSKLLGKLCGHNFPPKLTTTGPNVWLKFYSDDTIEDKGFHINVKYKEAAVQGIPDSCYKSILKKRSGEIDSTKIDKLCKSGSPNLEMLWTIETQENTMIYLNFTKYVLPRPNDCNENFVEVFGSVLEASARLAKYCGSIANPVTTKPDKNKKNINPNVKRNIMYVRLFATKPFKGSVIVMARFTAFRSLNTAKSEQCDPEDEFNCDDNTCIDINLICDSYADCRLKTDEDPERCKTVTTSAISQPQTLYILITFSLIISMIFFILLFKCIRKLYHDHKIIKELQTQSLEQRLNCLVERRLTLDAQKLRESESRASLDKDNRANEMSKKKRDSFSKRKLTSIESDLNQESLIDLDDELWRREAETHPIIPEDSRRRRETPDRKGKGKRIETLKEERSKEENEKKKELKETSGGVDTKNVEKVQPKRTDTKKDDSRSKRDSVKQEMEHVPFGALDTKESGCQTRDRLFQNVPPSSSDGSGTTTSGQTIAKPSPPATSTSEITIELPKQAPKQETKPQVRTDGRPISTETTRSAPDVIIVVKPM